MANEFVARKGIISLGVISGSGNIGITGDGTIGGNLTVGGTITAQEFKAELISSSIIYESGSTKFGDSLDDVHQRTGSYFVSGSSFNITSSNFSINSPTIAFSGNTTINGTLNATSTRASSVLIQQTSDNLDYYIPFTDFSDPTHNSLYIDTNLLSSIYYNPSTNLLKVGIISASSGLIYFTTSSNYIEDEGAGLNIVHENEISLGAPIVFANNFNAATITTTGNAKLGDAITDVHTVTGSLGISGSLALTTALPVSSGGTGQTSYTNGELLIGNTTGNTLTKATLTQGTGITITNGNGAITVTNASPNANHTGDVTGATALTITDSAVTNAKLANIDAGRIKGRITDEPGPVEDLTPTQVRTLINVADGATANTGTVTSVGGTGTVSGLTLSGTVTTSGNLTLGGTLSVATAAIEDNAVTNAKLRQSAGFSVVGKSTTGTGNVADIVAGSDHQILRRSGASIAFGAISLDQTNAVAGTLPIGNGGTGATSFTANRLLIGNTTSAITTSANLTFANNNLSVTGSVGINESSYGAQINSEIPTSQTGTVASVPTGSFNGVFFDYTIGLSTEGRRVGTVMATWLPGSTTVEFTDFSTLDIGNTAAIVMSVDINLANVRLRANNTGTTGPAAVVRTMTRAI
jgi:hypothetical protein